MLKRVDTTEIYISKMEHIVTTYYSVAIMHLFDHKWDMIEIMMMMATTLLNEHFINMVYGPDVRSYWGWVGSIAAFFLKSIPNS